MKDCFERSNFIMFEDPNKKLLVNLYSKKTLKNKKYFFDFKTNTFIDIDDTDIKIAFATTNKESNDYIFFINKERNIFNRSVNYENRTYYSGLTDAYKMSSYTLGNDGLKIDTNEDYYLEVSIVEASYERRVSKIFDNPPKQWGFRGDPYFWEYLKEILSNYTFPFEYDELVRIIKEEHLKLTGVNLNEESMGKCKKFEHGGMTSGGISGYFWINRAFPLLRSRIDKENKTSS